ncbi:MAG: serine hydrolase domain-containing protein [Gemmatimonas sp.]
MKSRRRVFKGTLLAILTPGVLTFAGCSPNDPAKTANNSDSLISAPSSARIDSIFAKVNRSDSPGCALGVYRAGKLVFAKGYGMANLEYAVPITASTRFDVASVSKQFTAFAVTLLARRGKISLDDNIRKYLTELPDFGTPVTIRQLIHQTSGLRAYEEALMLTGWNRDHPLTRAEVIAYLLRQRELSFPPGDRHLYSATNYVILAMLVERVDGRKWAEFMSQEVFIPLGMTHSLVRDDGYMIVPGRAEHYSPRNAGGFRKTKVWEFAYAVGSSNIVTTVEDLAKWDANFYDERVGGRGITSMLTARAALNSGDSAEYASGLRIGEYRGLRTISHGGSGGGDYILLRFPDQQFTTAVLCNLYQGAVTSSALAYQVSDLYLERALAPLAAAVADTLAKPSVKLSESELARYAGVYRSVTEPDERVEFVVHKGELAEVYDSVPHPTVALGDGRFRESPFTFTFTSSTPSAAMHLAVTRPGYNGEFVRDTAPPFLPTASYLAQFQGTYQSTELDVVWTFRVVRDSLMLSRERFPSRAVASIERDVFLVTDQFDDGLATSVLKFGRKSSGEINAFRLSGDRVLGLKFVRTQP